MPAAQLIPFTEQQELLGSVLADRVEHAVPVPVLLAEHDRFLDQPAKGAEKGVGGENFPGTHTFGRLQVEAAGEDR